MARKVQVAAGVTSIALPNGQTLSAGAITILSDAQWALVSSNPALIDLGTTSLPPVEGHGSVVVVTPVPDPGGGGGGTGGQVDLATIDARVVAVGDTRYATPSQVSQSVTAATSTLLTPAAGDARYVKPVDLSLATANLLNQTQVDARVLSVGDTRYATSTAVSAITSAFLTQAQVDARVTTVGDVRYSTPTGVDSKIATAVSPLLNQTQVDARVTTVGDARYSTPASVAAAIASGTAAFLTQAAVDARVVSVGDPRYAKPADITTAVSGLLSQTQVDARVRAVGDPVYATTAALTTATSGLLNQAQVDSRVTSIGDVRYSKSADLTPAVNAAVSTATASFLNQTQVDARVTTVGDARYATPASVSTAVSGLLNQAQVDARVTTVGDARYSTPATVSSAITSATSGLLNQTQVDLRVTTVGDARYATPASVSTAVSGLLNQTQVDTRVRTVGDAVYITPAGVDAKIAALPPSGLTQAQVDTRVTTVGDPRYATPTLVDQKIAAAGTGTGLSQDQVDSRVTTVGDLRYATPASVTTQITGYGYLNQAAVDARVTTVGDARYATPASVTSQISASGFLTQTQIDARVTAVGDPRYAKPADITAATSGLLNQTQVDARVRAIGDPVYATPTSVSTQITTATSGFLTQAQVDTRVSTVGDARYVTPTQLSSATSSLLNQTQVDARVRAVGDPVYATTASIAGLSGKVSVNPTTVTAGQTATRNIHYPVDASGAARTIILPTTGMTDGDLVVVEKTDASTNTVGITGPIRNATSTTSLLYWQYESMGFRWRSSDSTYWPAYGHKTKNSLDAAYAPVGAAFQTVVAESGDAITKGMPLRSNGLRITSPLTMTAAAIEVDGVSDGTSTWPVIVYHANGTQTTVATITVNPFSRTGIVAGLNISLVAGDRIYVANGTVSGTNYGYGPSCIISVGAGTTLTAMPTPATPGTFSAISGATGPSLSWAAVAAATGYLVVRDGVPWAEVYGATAFSETLASGESHAYRVAALSPGAISALSPTLTVGAVVNYTYFNQTDGAPQGMTTMTASGNVGGSVLVAANALHPLSGTTGTSAASDKVGAQFTLDGAAHSYFDISGLFSRDNDTSIVDLYLTSNAMSNTFGFTNGVQVEFSISQARLGFKASGSTTGYQNFTTLSKDNAGVVGYVTYGTAAGANVGTSVTFGAGTQVAFRAVLWNPNDGTGSLKVALYQGAAASLATIQGYAPGAGSPFLSATLTSAMLAGFTTTGYAWLVLNGPSGTTQSGVKFSNLTVVVG